MNGNTMCCAGTVALFGKSLFSCLGVLNSLSLCNVRGMMHSPWILNACMTCCLIWPQWGHSMWWVHLPTQVPQDILSLMCLILQILDRTCLRLRVLSMLSLGFASKVALESIEPCPCSSATLVCSTYLDHCPLLTHIPQQIPTMTLPNLPLVSFMAVSMLRESSHLKP